MNVLVAILSQCIDFKSDTALRNKDTMLHTLKFHGAIC